MTQSQTDIAAMQAELRHETEQLCEWADEYMRHGKAPTYDQPFATRAAIKRYDAALESLSQPRSVGVTEEMVERATAELLAHAICTEGPDAENKRLMRIAARLALTAALQPEGKGR